VVEIVVAVCNLSRLLTLCATLDRIELSFLDLFTRRDELEVGTGIGPAVSGSINVFCDNCGLRR